MQYGFAAGCQATRERSKKTEAVSAMQTQPAVCIARGGTKRQNKKSCCARLRFVSFDSDEGPGEIRNPPGSKPQTSEAFAVWKGRSGHRGLEPSLAVARSVVTVSDAPYVLSRRSEKERMKKRAPFDGIKNAEGHLMKMFLTVKNRLSAQQRDDFMTYFACSAGLRRSSARRT